MAHSCHQLQYINNLHGFQWSLLKTTPVLNSLLLNIQSTKIDYKSSSRQEKQWDHINRKTSTLILNRFDLCQLFLLSRIQGQCC